MRPHVNLFVAETNIRDGGGLAMRVPDGAEIAILPAVSGGSPSAVAMRLRLATSPAWTEAVLADFDAFLRDHAANERKASASALALVAHYPDRALLVEQLVPWQWDSDFVLFFFFFFVHVTHSYVLLKTSSPPPAQHRANRPS